MMKDIKEFFSPGFIANLIGWILIWQVVDFQFFSWQTVALIVGVALTGLDLK